MDTIAVVGLGYVGMPLAVEFAKVTRVIGYDRDANKICTYLNGEDPTNEVGGQAIAETTIEFTSDKTLLSQAKFFIVAVPTPIREDKRPNLEPLLEASETVGRYMTSGSVVVYESTVYPWLTEEFCTHVLENSSGLKWKKDFHVGYSPERINPGDRVHNLKTIKKIVSGDDEKTRNYISKVYNQVVLAGTYLAESISVAEAAKVVENTQRDINIAFMNELSILLNKMNLNTNEVINAMDTKWNSLGFRPGLVGGHCIGVDPYYLAYQAEKLGYFPQIISTSRLLNDGMGVLVADETIKRMSQAGKVIRGARVGVFGITFKENCPDVRNSKVNDIIRRLEEYQCTPVVFDPCADSDLVFEQYGIQLEPIESARNLDCVILAVAHKEFSILQEEEYLRGLFGTGEKIVVDVKGMLSGEKLKKEGYMYWSL